MQAAKAAARCTRRLGLDTACQGLVKAARRGQLTEAQARQLYELGPEAVTLALLAASQRIAELESKGSVESAPLGNPSSQVPVYVKPNVPKRSRRPGARAGHPGSRQARPLRIDRGVEHRLPRCPECGGRLQRCHRTRTRIIEDIPEPIQPVVTERVLHRDYRFAGGILSASRSWREGIPAEVGARWESRTSFRR